MYNAHGNSTGKRNYLKAARENVDELYACVWQIYQDSLQRNQVSLSVLGLLCPVNCLPELTQDAKLSLSYKKPKFVVLLDSIVQPQPV